MKNIQEIKKKVLNRVRVKLAEEFDRNFERQAFFDKKWKKSKSLHTLLVTGRLRRSLISRTVGENIVFSSDTPYAEIHNKGGKIKRRKGGTTTMPKRQFVGDSPYLKKPVADTIRKTLDPELREVAREYDKIFKRLNNR